MRVVMVSPVLPYDGVPHAGGQYLRRLVDLVASRADLTVVVPDTPANRTAERRPGVPSSVLRVGGRPATTLPGRAGNRVLEKADRRLRQLDPGTPSLPMARDLWRSGPPREALEAADVVDLQWQESVRLAGLVRRINPRARLVGTFHDVQSQLFARESASSAVARGYWRAAAAQARRHERRGVRLLDEVLVFSDKDATLLGDPVNLRVVPPPLADGTERPRSRPDAPPTVLFVAHFARDENDKAVQWLLADVWPAVAARCPGARLRLVGSGMTREAQVAVAARTDVSAPGYVDDLSPEYDGAWACVVPLRQGAGVKFKTIEALLHGVPTVTTTVGAEGIVGPDLFAGLGDDAATLVEGIVDVLEHPEEHARRADAAQAWARDRYGPDDFAERVWAAYGLPLGAGHGEEDPRHR